MIKLATIYRAAQFVAHEKHNLVYGPSFFEDHEFLGETYAAYEAAYDDVIERMIGLGQTVTIPTITTDAAAMAARPMNADTMKWPATLMSFEESIRKEIDVALKGASSGTQNLLQQLADDSEKRTYKLQQRHA